MKEEEKFIEKATVFPLKYGKLIIYETNTRCEDIKFYFQQYVLCMMLSGEKHIVTDSIHLHFIPGTFFIAPINEVQSISIPSATFKNPTKCLVLELEPNFVEHYYQEIISTVEFQGIETLMSYDEKYFISQNKKILDNLNRLYKNCLEEQTAIRDKISTLILKEFVLRLFQTQGLKLLLSNSVITQFDDVSIKQSILHMKTNLDKKLTVKQLARDAGLGTTSYINKFKRATGCSPIEFLLRERIKHAKVLLKKDEQNLKEIAYRCGFNSYEYFCGSFRKHVGVSPSVFKNK